MLAEQYAEDRYLRASFSGGALFDLTNEARSAEVRYVCMERASRVVILSIAEVATCSYVIVVGVPSLCQHPLFMANVRPSVVCFACCLPCICCHDTHAALHLLP